MKMAGFYDESMSNGIGWRAVLFVSGCPHNCLGCHNKVAQDFNYGEEFDENKIIERMKENSILKGVTISGGEPLCPENISEVNHFIERVRKELPKFNVWCYTGYTFEELKNREDEITNITLNNIDVLVDGRFIEARKNPEIKFRGSDNQRIIDLKKTLKENKIVELEV
ncbi:MAG: anaerobic ribonucleoside-triphosphate reductase activating protein [Clostridia bacterium]|nr:anaerobic ribonucleoside-triphosphate reductase activating protein [Clostridia bacterium]